ncbi:MAG: autotransporter outer membrane beta-barrel domain-containing protein [Planctomycetes bacterium]|nr:autotransporter outer membrane beta-barrel domain-containing protein [Planctomycetota bacterium]
MMVLSWKRNAAALGAIAITALLGLAVLGGTARAGEGEHILADSLVYSYSVQQLFIEQAPSAINRYGSSAKGFTAPATLTSGCNNIWVGPNAGYLVNKRRSGEEAKTTMDIYGVSLGYDRMFGNFFAGIAFGYDHGKYKVKNLGEKLDNKGDTFQSMIYGGFLANCFAIDAHIGYSRTWNKLDAYLEDGLDIEDFDGKFKNDMVSAGLKASYVYATPAGTRIVPSLGLNYSYVRQGSYTTRLGPDDNFGARMRLSSESYNRLFIPLEVRLDHTFQCGTIGITPMVKGGANFMVGPKHASVRVNEVGTADTWDSRAIKQSHIEGKVGAGVNFKFNKVDVGLDYQLKFAAKHYNNSFWAKVGFSF